MKTRTVEAIFITASFFIGMLVGAMIFRDFAMPSYIERRAKETGLLKYDSKQNEFIVADSTTITNGDYHYIRYGTTKNY